MVTQPFCDVSFLIHNWMPGTTSWTLRSESMTRTTSSSLSRSPGRSLASGSSLGSLTHPAGRNGSISESSKTQTHKPTWKPDREEWVNKWVCSRFSVKLTSSYLQVRSCLPQLSPRPGEIPKYPFPLKLLSCLGDLSCRLLRLAVRTINLTK